MEKTRVAIMPYILLASALLLVIAGAFIYGRATTMRQHTNNEVSEPEQLVVLGTVTRIEPLHIFLKGFGANAGQTFDILVHARTEMVQLAPWEPGEQEKAQKKYNETIARMVLKSGDPLPAPPRDMKLAPWKLDSAAIGTIVGVELDAKIENQEFLTARGIRPLTEKEITAKAVGRSFPW